MTTPLGWIVSVETDSGRVLYAVREAIAYKAEDRLRAALKLDVGTDVAAFEPIPLSFFESFEMALNPIRGPF